MEVCIPIHLVVEVEGEAAGGADTEERCQATQKQQGKDLDMHEPLYLLGGLYMLF